MAITCNIVTQQEKYARLTLGVILFTVSMYVFGFQGLAGLALMGFGIGFMLSGALRWCPLYFFIRSAALPSTEASPADTSKPSLQ